MSEPVTETTLDKLAAPTAETSPEAPAVKPADRPAERSTERSTERPDSTPARSEPHHLRWLTPAFFLAILALGLSLGLAWYSHDRLQTLQVQLAQRIGGFDNSAQEARAAAKEAHLVLNDMRARLAAMEGRSLETQSQQLALSAMYQELARGQDERLLADMEQTLLLAQQQLQLAGNVRAAIIGLEAVNSRLAGLNKPQFDRLRDAITRDVERLKLLPWADMVSLNARLDVILQNVGKLKLDAGPQAVVQAPVTAPAESGGQIARLARQAWTELQQLVRIRRMDEPEAPLLAPEQSWFLRQNLQLRLLSARIAAFQRDEAAFRADISAAREWVGRYFLGTDELTKSMLDSLQGLLSAPVAQGEADIADSIKVLRSYRAGEQG